MTEIPEHLRRRAEDARKRAEDQNVPFPWEMSVQVAQVIVSLANKLARADVRSFTPDEVDCMYVARVLVEQQKIKRLEAMRALLADYEAEHGVITPEEIAEIKRSMIN